MSEEQNQSNLPPIKLAFIIDGEIVDILHTDERLAAIFTSNPLIVDVTENLSQEGNKISIGTKWDDQNQGFIIEENNVQE